MSKKIQLSEEQRKHLNKLWWIYGNNGSRSTLFNHKLIQGFLEAGEDRRDDYSDTNKNIIRKYGKDFSKDKIITQDCLNAVAKIIDFPNLPPST